MDAKINYQIVPSNSQIPTVRAQVGDRAPFYLHSTVQPYLEAEDWVKRLELTPDTCYIVLGVGLGYHVGALLGRLPENSRVLVLHTKSEDVLVKHVTDMSEHSWLADKRLEFLHITNMHDMAVIIGDIMIGNVIKKVCLCRHFPTMLLAEMEYQAIEAELVPRIEKVMALNFNIRVTTEHLFLQNYWRNFLALVLNSDCERWRDAFKDVPVIMVAAGPSLNKNIAELKQCADKAVIIAAGSTVGALHKHGITPHFLVVTDAHQVMYDEVKDFFSVDTVLVASTNVQHKVVANYPGPKCFFETWHGYDDGFGQYLPNLMYVRQTGSVATAAVDFANQCGARSIIFVGQDLAFEDKQSHHADGVRAGGLENFSTIKVPGYYGGEVNTVASFSVIIEHYNQYVPKHGHIDFINATEGGALISSMRNLPLQTVRQQILKKNVDTDKLLAVFGRNDKRTKFNKISEKLIKLANWLANLDHQIQEFCEKENAIISANSQRAVIQQDIQRFDKLYEQIKQRKAYPYIRLVVEGWKGLLELQTRDGMPLDQQYEFYWNITRELQEVLTNLAEAIADNIKVIEDYK